MAEIKPVYQTSDGAKFATSEEAQRHQFVIDAQRNFEEAQRALSHVLAQRALTADGVPFSFGRWGQYFWISHSAAHGMPALGRVSFYSHSTVSIETDGGVELRADLNGKPCTFRIAELYANERAAKVALLAECEKHLAWFSEDVAKLRKEVAAPAVDDGAGERRL